MNTPKSQSERRRTLRAARKRAGVTLQALAAFVDLDFSLISLYENGKRTLTPETFARLMDAIPKAADAMKRKEEDREAQGQAIAEELRPIMKMMEASPQLVAMKKKEIPVALGMLQMAKAQGWKPAPEPVSTGALASALAERDPVYEYIVDTLAKQRKKEADAREHIETLNRIAEGDRAMLELTRRLGALDAVQRAIQENPGQPLITIQNPVNPDETITIKTEKKTEKTADGQYQATVRLTVSRSITERKRQLSELETLKGKGVDDPIVVELIESFRREIAQKEKEIENLNKVLEEK